MKRFLSLSIFFGILTMFLTGCSTEDTTEDTTPDNVLPEEPYSEWANDKTIEYTFNDMFGTDLIDTENNFNNTNSIDSARILVNGVYENEFYKTGSTRDVQMEFYNSSSIRLVNASGGMAYTIPYVGDTTFDYSIAKYRTQITFGDSILSASAEYGNPYATNSTGWGIYRDEWLLEFINSDAYMKDNNLKVINKIYNDREFREGYEVYSYSIEIQNAGKMDKPFYNVGIIKEENEFVQFGLFVMKSESDKSDVMDTILNSYTKLRRSGTAKNYYDAGAPEEDPLWSDETKLYYEMLNSQTTTQWGSFNRSMPGGKNDLTAGSGIFDTELAMANDLKNILAEKWDQDLEIYPTYTHISFYNNMHYFPLDMANELAGGNGFNGKPVLQFTYQFTTNNNLVNAADGNGTKTPMFDILRGDYDEHFLRLAEDIKAYGKPVLFRLNNEMNTDWTSYCGMMTLLDPDVFNMTWRYLYNLFEENGVDNCIWIWNAYADSYPYSSWGEDLCYNPGKDYVHLLGLTSYEMMNDVNNAKSFEERYSELDEKNDVAWEQYTAIISEFACGSGGESSGILGRFANEQAKWVTEMFECLNDPNRPKYIKRIAGIVWFNVNDYVYDSTTKQYIISNRLRLCDSALDPWDENYDDLQATHDAFKLGFKNRNSYSK